MDGMGTFPRGSSDHLFNASTPNERPTKSNTAQPRRTMGQKAPSRALSGGNTALLKDFEESAKQLLALALPRRGPVVFEVGILTVERSIPGAANAPLHILQVHMNYVAEHNSYCFDLLNKPRMPVCCTKKATRVTENAVIIWVYILQHC